MWLELSIQGLEEGQAAVAEPSSLGGMSLLREWPRGASETTPVREGRNFLPKRNLGNPSVHSATFYTPPMQRWFLVWKESNQWGEWHREEVREPISNKHLQCSRNKARSCLCIIGGNPCDSVSVMDCIVSLQNSYVEVLKWLDLKIRPFKEIRSSEAESRGGSQVWGDCDLVLKSHSLGV